MDEHNRRVGRRPVGQGEISHQQILAMLKRKRLLPKNGGRILDRIILSRAELTDFASVPTTENQKKQNDPPTSNHLLVVDPESKSTPSAHRANRTKPSVNPHVTLR
jgi:hypothetical protein